MAMRDLDLNFEHYRVCEWDKYAIQSYNAIHGTSDETSDIRLIGAEDLGITDTDKYCYVVTYSFPCQDLSKAGKGRGMEKGSGTRSGLLWEVERLLDESKELPQVLLMENVPDVIGKKNIRHFAEWIAKLEQLGYRNYWQVLNAKDYGIPQNRNRCFMLSISGDYYYEFPKGLPLELRLKDMLEEEVNEKYYLSNVALKYILAPKRFNSWTNINPEIAMTLTAVSQTNWTGTFICDSEIVQVAQLVGGKWVKTHEQSRRVFSPDGISPTIHTMGGGNQEIKIIDEQNGYMRNDGCVGTLTTDGSSPKHNNRIIQNNRVRKLTPRECWRLMGFADDDFDKAKAAGVSDCQLYKQAGNSIVKTVLMAIFGELFSVDWKRKVNEITRRYYDGNRDTALHRDGHITAGAKTQSDGQRYLRLR